jgi:hypothetical protein
MGEQLAMRAMRGRSLTIVRPSIIEHAGRTGAGLDRRREGGRRHHPRLRTRQDQLLPGQAEEVVDIVPADLVANSICWLPPKRCKAPAMRIYQACTGATNPITVGRVIALIKASRSATGASMSACSTTSRNTISVWSAARCSC